MAAAGDAASLEVKASSANVASVLSMIFGNLSSSARTKAVETRDAGFDGAMDVCIEDAEGDIGSAGGNDGTSWLAAKSLPANIAVENRFVAIQLGDTVVTSQ